MCVSYLFGLISYPKKSANFFGNELSIFVWKKSRIWQIYLLDFNGELLTGNEYIKLPFCY